MSKRNSILLIISLIILTIVAFSYFSSYKQKRVGPSSGTNFLSEFFPFGNNSTSTPTIKEEPVDVSGFISNQTEATPKNRLIKISSMQIAGYGIFMRERFKEVISTPEAEIVSTNIKNTNKIKPKAPETEFVPALRYVNRINGNIYQTFSDKIAEQQITKTVIPQVYEASFGNKGDSVVMRYLNNSTNIIETFVGSLPKEILGGDTMETNEIIGSFLPNNISDLSISSDTLKIFYLINNNTSSSGITSNYLGDKKDQIFSSPFTEWLSLYPTNNMITLTTKPSSGVPGYMYKIDPSRKNLVKILGDIKGLTTLTSPDGKKVLFNDNNLTLKIFDISNSQFLSVGAKTLTEKCAWNKTSTIIYCAIPKYTNTTNLPDSWYQGEVSFDDEIWKINASDGNASKITDLSTITTSGFVDAIKLSVDDGENYLFFVNKNDPYLWGFYLK